jgi:hypothetical protein
VVGGSLRASTEIPSARQEMATVNREVNFMIFRSMDEERECGKKRVVGFNELDYLMYRRVSANVRADRLFDGTHTISSAVGHILRNTKKKNSKNVYDKVSSRDQLVVFLIIKTFKIGGQNAVQWQVKWKDKKK